MVNKSINDISPLIKDFHRARFHLYNLMARNNSAPWESNDKLNLQYTETTIKINLSMRNQHGILSLILAILLVVGNLAYSGHLSTHNPADPNLCVLCIHPGGTDSAITAEAGGEFLVPIPCIPKLDAISALPLPEFLHDHQSRAPPFPI
jgi:hypothetical protein